jgi:DNA helicase-2/ATP-dependent DNA helicase PcrA
VPQEEDGAAVLDDAPTVSTYHAYAGRIVREHGVRLGVEAESRLLSEAAAWQVAHESVVAYDGPMDEVEKAESTVTTAVVDLAGEMAEHLVDVDAVAAHLDEVVAALELIPRGEASTKKAFPKEVRGRHRRAARAARDPAAHQGLPGPQALARQHGLRRPGAARRPASR